MDSKLGSLSVEPGYTEKIYPADCLPTKKKTRYQMVDMGVKFVNDRYTRRHL